jgi:hypothetical protein
LFEFVSSRRVAHAPKGIFSHGSRAMYFAAQISLRFMKRSAQLKAHPSKPLIMHDLESMQEATQTDRPQMRSNRLPDELVCSNDEISNTNRKPRNKNQEPSVKD